MKFAVTLFAIMSSSLTVHASAPQTKNMNKAGTIVCTESNEDFDEIATYAVITVNLNANGRADRINIQRPASEDVPALEASFDLKNSKIVHQMFATGDDPALNICQADAQGCAKEVEKVIATGSDRSSFELRINDHQYGGVRGSSFAITLGDLHFDTKDTPNLTACQGPVMEPDRLLMLDQSEWQK